MLINVDKDFKLVFKRGGGAMITAQVVFRVATPTGWKVAGVFPLSKVFDPVEAIEVSLAPGTRYMGTFKCEVEEQLNGAYDYEFSVNGTKVYFDQDDVNTTSNAHDSIAFKGDFVVDTN